MLVGQGSQHSTRYARLEPTLSFIAVDVTKVCRSSSAWWMWPSSTTEGAIESLASAIILTEVKK
jgi:hypothetical protein